MRASSKGVNTTIEEDYFAYCIADMLNLDELIIKFQSLAGDNIATRLTGASKSKVKIPEV